MVIENARSARLGWVDCRIAAKGEMIKGKGRKSGTRRQKNLSRNAGTKANADFTLDCADVSLSLESVFGDQVQWEGAVVAIKCSACGETSARHQVARSEYSPVAPQVIGGILLAFVFTLSRKRRFRCDR